MSRRTGCAAWAAALGLVAGACDRGAGREASVAVELFSAEFRSADRSSAEPLDLKNDTASGGIVDELEVVVARAEDPTRPATETFPVADRGGVLPGIDFGPRRQIFVRGFVANGNDPLIYGASVPFAADDDDLPAIGVQIGRADCVGLNAAAAVVEGPRGTIDFVVGRIGFTFSTLPDGRVLIVGGARIGPEGRLELLADIEIYDPNRGEFFPAAVSLPQPRAFHTTSPIGDGRFLVFGGLTADPAAPDIRTVTGAPLVLDLDDDAAPVKPVPGVLDEGLARYGHRATVLPARRGAPASVLITGGFGPDGRPQKRTVRFFPGPSDDPARGELVPQADLCEGRVQHTATALVHRGAELAVLAGGLADLVDAALDPLAAVGGGEGRVLDSVEVFSVNPQQQCCGGVQPSEDGRVGCFVKPAGRVLESPRWGHRAVRVDADRQVLFVGGYASADRADAPAGLELLDAGLEMHGAGEVGALPDGRGEFTATALPARPFADRDGGKACDPVVDAACLPDTEVVITGGRRGERLLRDVLRLSPVREANPADGTALLRGFRVRPAAPECALSEARFAHAAIRLTTGTVLLGGGLLGSSDRPLTSRRAEIYFPKVPDVRVLFPDPPPLTD